MKTKANLEFGCKPKGRQGRISAYQVGRTMKATEYIDLFSHPDDREIHDEAPDLALQTLNRFRKDVLKWMSHKWPETFDEALGHKLEELIDKVDEITQCIENEESPNVTT